MFKAYAFLVVACCSFAGCVQMMSPEELRSVSDDELFNAIYRTNMSAFGSSVPASLVDEARRRKMFTDAECELIRYQKVAIGMSEKALQASWGYARINTTTTATDVFRQWVYPSVSRSKYVYTHNGVVTAIQSEY